MKREDIHKVLIIGSGPIIIGQACEFDYSGTQACKALKSLGYEIVLVNSNPATIMTDPETADVTYIEPLNVERLEQIIEKERPDALLPNLGGQSGLNLCSELQSAGVLDKYGVKVIGVQVDAIERGEDRIEFKNTMNALGVEMARSDVAYSVDEALSIADGLGYPVVLRPAYTMGGAGGGSMVTIIILYAVIIGIFWFFAIRPQKKQQKEHETLVSTLEVGDSILTSSGFFGVVIDIMDDVVIVEFGSNKNCRIPMKKENIVEIDKQDNEE